MAITRTFAAGGGDGPNDGYTRSWSPMAWIRYEARAGFWIGAAEQLGVSTPTVKHWIERETLSGGSLGGNGSRGQSYPQRNTGARSTLPPVAAYEERAAHNAQGRLWRNEPERFSDAHKAARIQALDPDSGELVRVFHPGRDSWAEPFNWAEDNVIVLGLTAIGRATIAALQLNGVAQRRARLFWLTTDFFP